ncbi:molybdenum cofactor biosynthesis protein MoaE [Agromyces seonyuensis]|uniref:Molybdenum cofactor biosynthesis protein MoaB n=1 Tax=Agromyces seonyuensis TaxID=2662446 RepID=A0A6I4NYK9_9MICO|nr:molybdenum cofactor biosynthesis protein MoaE [Agromyces seonyuensis]MWB97525.1 molybdenum cofactor biosynthesis protein MoaB [Agromyces seonyuensis]
MPEHRAPYSGAPNQDASPRRVAVVIASNRAAAGVYPDDTGPMIAEWAAERGWTSTVSVVPDGPAVGTALRTAIASGASLVLSSGGTGVSPTDRTPEEAAPLLDHELPGLMEEFRRRGAARRSNALLSRGVAGIAGRSLVVTLPGSPGAVREGLALLDELVDHVLDQLDGGDHVRMPDVPGVAAGTASAATAPAPAHDHGQPHGHGHADAHGATSPEEEAGRVAFARVSETTVSVEECAAAVAGDADGAVVTFAGVVRDHDDGRGVRRLEYTGHPDAERIIGEVCRAVAREHPAVAIAAAHRVGPLGIGDLALACAVASAHRAEAFAACAALVDRIKAETPIWKEQFFDDGSAEWVGALG